MYKARNGFTLIDDQTPDGWTIETPHDIITALLSNPEFETVATDFIFEAIAQAIEIRKDYADIGDLARELITNYI